MDQTLAEETGGGVTRHSPGLVVQIINSVGEVERTIGPPPPGPMINVTPERDALEP